jgi:hypothetical protein
MIRVTQRTAVGPAGAIWCPTMVRVWLGCATALCGFQPAPARSAGPVAADARIQPMDRAQAEQGA